MLVGVMWGKKRDELEGYCNQISSGILDLVHQALKLRIGSFSHGEISRIPQTFINCNHSKYTAGHHETSSSLIVSFNLHSEALRELIIIPMLQIMKKEASRSREMYIHNNRVSEQMNPVGLSAPAVGHSAVLLPP